MRGPDANIGERYLCHTNCVMTFTSVKVMPQLFESWGREEGSKWLVIQSPVRPFNEENLLFRGGCEVARVEKGLTEMCWMHENNNEDNGTRKGRLEKHLKFELTHGSKARDGHYAGVHENARIEIMEEGYSPHTAPVLYVPSKREPLAILTSVDIARAPLFLPNFMTVCQNCNGN